MAFCCGDQIFPNYSYILNEIQKRAIRISENASYNAHTDPLFKKLNLLKINDMINLEILKFVHKFIYGKLPKSLMLTYKLNSETHTHNTRSKNYPKQPNAKFALLRNSFVGKGPSLWQNMENNLKEIVPLKGFTKKLKHNLIELY